MRLDAVLAPLLVAASVTARSWAGFGNNQQSLSDTPVFPVPGDSPLEYCEEPNGWILAIDSVDIDPNPPTAGTTLNFTASGVFAEDVEEGAQVKLSVVYNKYITLVKQTADLCETVQQVDLSCPLEKGPITLTKSVELPELIPAGVYTVIAHVTTKDGETVTCLQAKVQFSS